MTELEKLAQWHEKRADYFWQDKAWEPIKELADHHTDAAATIRAAMAENARLREALQQIQTGGIFGEPRSYRATLDIVREIARAVLKETAA